MRLYHFLPQKWALRAIRDQRLKGSTLDDTNDVFELLPYESQGLYQAYSKWRTAREWVMLCLSETYKNPLMWGHYADKGRGMCLGFDVIDDDPGELFPPEVIKVAYEPDRVKTGYVHPHLGEDRAAFLPAGLFYGLVKYSHWEYEKEWRMWRNIEGVLPDPITGLHYFSFGDKLKLCKILIGPHCEENDIRDRLDQLTDDYDLRPDIRFARPSDSHFSIKTLL